MCMGCSLALKAAMLRARSCRQQPPAAAAAPSGSSSPQRQPTLAPAAKRTDLQPLQQLVVGQVSDIGALILRERGEDQGW